MSLAWNTALHSHPCVCTTPLANQRDAERRRGKTDLSPRASGGAAARASAVSDAAAADAELGYPFVKIVGQEELKLALTLNVVVRVPVVFTGAARPTSRAFANARGPESGHGNASSLSRHSHPGEGTTIRRAPRPTEHS